MGLVLKLHIVSFKNDFYICPQLYGQVYNCYLDFISMYSLIPFSFSFASSISQICLHTAKVTFCLPSSAFFLPLIDCILRGILISFSYPYFFLSRLISFSLPSINLSFQIFFLGYSVSCYRGRLGTNQECQRVPWDLPLEPSLHHFLSVLLISRRACPAPRPLLGFHKAFNEFSSLSFNQDEMCLG